MCDFFDRTSPQLATALAISVSITLAFLLSPLWSASDSFIANLVTTNSLLIAAIGVLASFVAEGSRFLYWTNKVEAAYWQAVNQHNPIGTAMGADLHKRNITFLILLPIIAIIPYFVSVILALGALGAPYMLRSMLTALSLWLMLWAFISIPLVLWRLTIFQRTAIKRTVT